MAGCPFKGFEECPGTFKERRVRLMDELQRGEGQYAGELRGMRIDAHSHAAP